MSFLNIMAKFYCINFVLIIPISTIYLDTNVHAAIMYPLLCIIRNATFNYNVS